MMYIRQESEKVIAKKIVKESGTTSFFDRFFDRFFRRPVENAKNILKEAEAVGYDETITEQQLINDYIREQYDEIYKTEYISNGETTLPSSNDEILLKSIEIHKKIIDKLEFIVKEAEASGKITGEATEEATYSIANKKKDAKLIIDEVNERIELLKNNLFRGFFTV